MKYGDRNNKKLVEDSIELFHRHWDQLTSNSAGPADRYSCVAELSNVMRKKKGAITDEDCIAWCYIVLVALHAPDSFFSRFSEVDLNSSEKIELLEEEIKCYFGYIDSVKEHDSILYPYIKCARELLERLNNRGRKVIKAETKEETGNLSKILHTKFEEELRQRNLDKNESVSNQKFQICSVKLEERYPWLSLALDDIGYFVSYPVLFAFLPYYLFMNLAKDEKWLSDRKEPFTCIQLNPNTLRWSIRNSPFEVRNGDDIDSLLSLYHLVERVLYDNGQKDALWTTGKLFFNKCGGEYEFKKGTKKPLDASAFSLLPANINKWAKAYFRGFVSDTSTLLRKKLTDIFCKINLKSPEKKRASVRELICSEFGEGVNKEFEVWKKGSWQKCGYSPCDIMEALIEFYSPGVA